jgi:2-oxoisovalerate dehydrogenase E1 component
MRAACCRTALDDPDPVLIFENVMLYNMTGQIGEVNAGPVDIDKAAVRRDRQGRQLITYGGSLFKTLEAAEELAKDGHRRRGDRPAVACARSTWTR